MKKTVSPYAAPLVSLMLLLGMILIWYAATLPPPAASYTPEQREYAILMGDLPEDGSDVPVGNPSDFPTPAGFAKLGWDHLSQPFYDNGPNDKGIGIQLGYSLLRVLAGYLLAVAVAIPLGYIIGMSPLISKALSPYIQLLKPISPLAWMPIALYTIKDSNMSAIFVIFICSLWPMLMNTAFGVANVRKDWLNVAATLEVKPFRKAFKIILPAAAPAILTGMRISMGIAWLVIVAAEMLVGGTGIGYFVWNQWNNLSLGNVVFAVLLIGIVGMLLDMSFGWLQKKVTYIE
ncbi:nitrate ABC transporter permease [Uruburuella testudinis]|uniref:Nitrate ABC transporter permease n=1 Tax=Uruburuella testudinis TaxID=1282863 RepID=A0ABY4DT92_9NEIS|nr:nitrate ABC transporter permease [Uruburuella testudinis]UOO81914.1 nitrate ABC transporter permease [Uruburuella testudinis]